LRHLGRVAAHQDGPRHREALFCDSVGAARLRGRAFRLLLVDCPDQGTYLGIPAAPGLHAELCRNLRRDGIVADCWISSAIALCTLRRRAISNTSRCRTALTATPAKHGRLPASMGSPITERRGMQREPSPPTRSSLGFPRFQ
jgi:hypothetical protein